MGKKLTIEINENGTYSVSFDPIWKDFHPKEIGRAERFAQKAWKQERANELIKKRQREHEEAEKQAAIKAKEQQEKQEALEKALKDKEKAQHKPQQQATKGGNK